MIRTDLLQHPDCPADDAAAAEWLKVHDDRFDPVAEVTVKTVTDRLGPAVAGRLVATLEAVGADNPLVRHTLRLLESGQSVPPGNPATRGMLASFAAVAQLPLTPADADAITGLAARFPAPTAEAVSAARQQIVRQDAADVALAALETYASGYRDAVNAHVADGTPLPESPLITGGQG